MVFLLLCDRLFGIAIWRKLWSCWPEASNGLRCLRYHHSARLLVSWLSLCVYLKCKFQQADVFTMVLLRMLNIDSFLQLRIYHFICELCNFCAQYSLVSWFSQSLLPFNIWSWIIFLFQGHHHFIYRVLCEGCSVKLVFMAAACVQYLIKGWTCVSEPCTRRALRDLDFS